MAKRSAESSKVKPATKGELGMKLAAVVASFGLLLVLVLVLQERKSGLDPPRDPFSAELTDTVELRRVTEAVSRIIRAQGRDHRESVEVLEALAVRSAGAADLRQACVNTYRGELRARELTEQLATLLGANDGGSGSDASLETAVNPVEADRVYREARAAVALSRDSKDRCLDLYAIAVQKLGLGALLPVAAGPLRPSNAAIDRNGKLPLWVAANLDRVLATMGIGWQGTMVQENSSARRAKRAELGTLALVVFLGASVACRNKPASPEVDHDPAHAEGPREAAPAVAFEVREDSSDLSFVWFDEHGAAHPANRVSEVPAASRGQVRVDPLRPELRAPGWVYVTDLRSPGSDGRFPVRVVPSEEFANGLAMLSGLAQAMAAPPRAPTVPRAQGGPSPTLTVPSPSGSPGAPGTSRQGDVQVVIYGASWCSACHQTAAWLRSRNIPFIERDIERDPGAAQELATMARAQHVPTGSIPIVDVKGRLLVGFNPAAIEQALRGG